MTVIIDASALSAFLLEEDGNQVRKIRELLTDGVYATDVVFTESCNAILIALRRRRISEEEAQNALDVLLSLYDSNIKVVKQDAGVLREAYREARESGAAIYDIVYLALAKRMRGELVSQDPKQIEIARKLGIKVISV